MTAIGLRFQAVFCLIASLLILAGSQVSAAGYAGETKALGQSLGGTRWLWHAFPDRVLELRSDGKFALDDWAQQGIEAKWKATGPREVTVTVTSRKFKDLTATLVFDANLTSFTGLDLGRKRVITPSPRLGSQPGGGFPGGPQSGNHLELTTLLGGTMWYWHGRQDRVAELRKDGTFALDDWAQQGLTATWHATGPREVTVTVTSPKFHGQTATLLFPEDLSSFTGTDLDKNRPILTSPRADSGAELAARLGSTRWLWHGKRDRVLKLRKDGVFDLDDWTQQGLTAVWQSTGQNEVTITVTSQKFRGLTATLVFANGLRWFTGTDLDKNRQIAKSPRA